MSSVSSPMPSSSATAAFELPAMPGSYEDFEFSLNLPENITASDFSLVATPEFSSLFGLPMSSFGESASSAAAAVSAPSGGGMFTPALTPSATTTHWKMSAPGTPRGVGTTEAPIEDTVMSHSFSTAPQPISMPMGAMTMPTGPPPQPTSAPLFSFDQLSAQAPGLPVPNANARALFDASEAHFLTNFLSGFEGWDFNPNLPIDLPSFADAEKSAVAMGSPTVYTDNVRRNNHRARASGGGAGNGGSGSSARNRGSPYGAAYASHASPGRTGMENVNAAFGLPMQDWHGGGGGGGGEDSDMNAATTSRSRQSSGMTGKKIKTEHGSIDGMRQQAATTAQTMQQHASEEPEKRNNHILSEQRRRNHIREAFKELVDLLEAGRDYGARGLGLSSGAGTGIEDEGLDDRSDYESTLEDEEPSAATKRRKLKARRRAALEAARKAGATGHAAAAAFINGGGRGKGRGRGGSAGGGAGSKSAVLFQAVDLLHWLDGRNSVLAKHIETLEDAVAQP